MAKGQGTKHDCQVFTARDHASGPPARARPRRPGWACSLMDTLSREHPGETLHPAPHGLESAARRQLRRCRHSRRNPQGDIVVGGERAGIELARLNAVPSATGGKSKPHPDPSCDARLAISSRGERASDRPGPDTGNRAARHSSECICARVFSGPLTAARGTAAARPGADRCARPGVVGNRRLRARRLRSRAPSATRRPARCGNRSVSPSARTRGRRASTSAECIREPGQNIAVCTGPHLPTARHCLIDLGLRRGGRSVKHRSLSKFELRGCGV